MDGSSNSSPEVGNSLGLHVHCDDDMIVRRGSNVVFGLDGREHRRGQEGGKDGVKHLRTLRIQKPPKCRVTPCIMQVRSVLQGRWDASGGWKLYSVVGA